MRTGRKGKGEPRLERSAENSGKRDQKGGERRTQGRENRGGGSGKRLPTFTNFPF